MSDLTKFNIALEKSLRLQCHYAMLLNMTDGGARRDDFTIESWIEKLKEIGDIK